MPNLPILITDLDGTVVNFLDEVLAQIYEATGVALTPGTCRQYNMADAFSQYLCPHNGPSHFTSIRALDEFLRKTCYRNPDMFAKAKPYWELWRALLYYTSKGGELHVVTARATSDEVKSATEQWVRHWLPSTKTIAFAGEFAGADTAERKFTACRHIVQKASFGDSVLRDFVYIDDHPQVADYIAERAPHRSNVIVPTRPWTTVAVLKHTRVGDASYYVQDIVMDTCIVEEYNAH